MLLKFYAREDLLVHYPGMTPAVGQVELFVGRSFDPATRTYPATKEPAEFDHEQPAGQRLLERMAREQPYPLWPADEATASMCGVEFGKVSFKDGAYVKAPEAKVSSPTSEGKK